jgi:hypothetical protein
MVPRKWSEARGVLLDFFYLQDGMYRHKRIDVELATAEKMIDAKTKAGKEGAKKRWQTHSSRIRKQNSTLNTTGIAEPLAEPCDRTAPLPSPSHSASAEKNLSPIRGQKPARAKSTLNGHSREFDEFWNAYPRRVAKGKAVKAYLKALGKADASTILAGAHRYADLRKNEDATYTAYPASWLNGECWTDDFTVGPNTAPDPKLVEIEAIEAAFRKEKGYE